MFSDIKILLHQGKQFIPDLTTVEVPGIFRGRPVISSEKVDTHALVDLCPANAISSEPVSIDMGKCLFCGECQLVFPSKIRFSKDYKLSSNLREGLVIRESTDEAVKMDAGKVRKEIRRLFGGSLKLRHVSAGGDNSCEWELNATGNVNFDMGRFGIEFVASPRHADGIVITGPISRNMAVPLQLCYDAVPYPKIIILAGTDAISGGLFAGSPDIDRSFLDKYPVDLFVPGNPVHPLTFINGLLDMIGNRRKG
jgi:Ni,Fe-hydrogenase III small subunit